MNQERTIVFLIATVLFIIMINFFSGCSKVTTLHIREHKCVIKGIF